MIKHPWDVKKDAVIPLEPQESAVLASEQQISAKELNELQSSRDLWASIAQARSEEIMEMEAEFHSILEENHKLNDQVSGNLWRTYSGVFTTSTVLNTPYHGF